MSEELFIYFDVDKVNKVKNESITINLKKKRSFIYAKSNWISCG